MATQWTYRFRINGFTPETLPLSRLLKYLEPLKKLLGSDRVHLMEVQEGSAAPVFWVPEEARAYTDARLASVAAGDAEPDAAKAYDVLNALLNKDGTGASLESGDGAEIIAFPGREENLVLRGVRQAGDFDGVVIAVGGKDKTVPVRLETFDGVSVGNFNADRDMAKRLAKRLFEPTRLYGLGTWSRTAQGDWTLDKFQIQGFEALEPVSIPDAVARLRDVFDGLPEDVNRRILHDRIDEAV